MVLTTRIVHHVRLVCTSSTLILFIQFLVGKVCSLFRSAGRICFSFFLFVEFILVVVVIVVLVVVSDGSNADGKVNLNKESKYTSG